jgi:hypothetical protein
MDVATMAGMSLAVQGPGQIDQRLINGCLTLSPNIAALCLVSYLDFGLN